VPSTVVAAQAASRRGSSQGAKRRQIDGTMTDLVLLALRR
jgi:hypothetical protein